MTLPIPYNKDFVFVPYWIKNAVLRHGHDLDLLAQPHQLREICSLQDLAVMALMNTDTAGCNRRFLGPLSRHMGYGFSQLWHRDAESSDFVTRQLLPLAPQAQHDFESRLIDPAARQARYTQPCEIIDRMGSVFFVVIYPGFFGAPEAASYQKELVRQILNVFYVHEGFDGMSQSSLYEQHVMGL